VQLQELASNLDVRVLIVASSTCLTLIIGGARRSGKEQSVLHKLIGLFVMKRGAVPCWQ
jgi:hypothetical protein